MNWKRSSFCASGACVLVAFDGNRVHVRDSKLGDTSPVITYTLDEWRRDVVEEIQAGGWLPEYTYRNFRGETVMRRQIGGTELYFTGPEWDAFVEGVRHGECDPQPAVA